MESWRLLSYGEADGLTNMAIDEAILDAHINGLVPTTLRLYGFCPPTMTIGLSQKMAPELVAEIEAKGIPVVRRPTGGRAVLHLQDLTYSFVGSDSTRGGVLSTSVTESYRQICQGLIAFFAELGVSTELGATGVAYRHLQDCFMATTGCDLHHGGTKLIGSAQTRKRGAILQHGSVPLQQQPDLMPSLLQEAPGNEKRHLNLFDLTKGACTFAELEQAFKAGFERTFGVRLELAHLTELEEAFVQAKTGSRLSLTT